MSIILFFTLYLFFLRLLKNSRITYLFCSCCCCLNSSNRQCRHDSGISFQSYLVLLMPIMLRARTSSASRGVYYMYLLIFFPHLVITQFMCLKVHTSSPRVGQSKSTKIQAQSGQLEDSLPSRQVLSVSRACDCIQVMWFTVNL